jgi:hypothetical protein
MQQPAFFRSADFYSSHWYETVYDAIVSGTRPAKSFYRDYSIRLLIEGTRIKHSGEVTMAKIRQTEIEEEPVGIVISSGSRAEKAPRLIAYVWGPAPTDSEVSGEMVAA